ncbi:MAG: cupin domain-containing protein [Smithellaceae bacterium]
MTAEEIIRLLDMEPLHEEGGFFKSSYRSSDVLPTTALPGRYNGPRHLGSAIYYLLTPDTCSRMHRLPTDELFHFYLGDPVNLLLLYPDGTSDVLTMGQDIFNGQSLQTLVPRGCWQGSFLIPGGSFALMGTTLCPGFDYDDYEAGGRKALASLYPDRKAFIEKLTEEN